MKAMYDLQPEKISNNGNGSITYRWDIKEVEMPRQMGETVTTETKWQCSEVIVWGTITRSKIVRAVIEEKWGMDVESKLMNDYNAAVIGVLPIEYKTRYTEFLTDRKAVKDQINADCAEIWL